MSVRFKPKVAQIGLWKCRFQLFYHEVLELKFYHFGAGGKKEYTEDIQHILVVVQMDLPSPTLHNRYFPQLSVHLQLLK